MLKFNPVTGQFDLIRSIAELNTHYLRLDCTNDPLLATLTTQDVVIPDTYKLLLGTLEYGQIYSLNNDIYIDNVGINRDIIFRINDGGIQTEVARFDGSEGQFRVIQHSSSIEPFVIGSATVSAVGVRQFQIRDSLGNIEMAYAKGGGALGSWPKSHFFVKGGDGNITVASTNQASAGLFFYATLTEASARGAIHFVSTKVGGGSAIGYQGNVLAAPGGLQAVDEAIGGSINIIISGPVNEAGGFDVTPAFIYSNVNTYFGFRYNTPYNLGTIGHEAAIYLEDVKNGLVSNAILTHAGNVVINNNNDPNTNVTIKGQTKSDLFQTDAQNDIVELNGGQKVNIRVITTNDTALLSDHTILIDTSGGEVTLSLPQGQHGQKYRIMNVGDSGNDALIDGYGLEEVWGEEVFTLTDGDIIIIEYTATFGWR